MVLYSIKGNAQEVVAVEGMNSLNLRALYPNPTELENVKQGLLILERFLKKADSTNIDSISDPGREVLKWMFEIAPSRNWLYEIVAMTPLTPHTATYSINAYLVFPNNPLKLFKGLLELGVDLQKKMVFPIYNSNYTTVDYPHISYHLKKSALQSFLPNLEKGNSYASFILKSIKEKCPGFISPPKRLSYIIADGYYNGLEYLGIHNYFLTSRFSRASNTVIDVSAKGFYKHEIIHYIFSNYKLCRFLDEGIATFISGGEDAYGRNPADELNAIKNKIKADKKFASLLNNTDSLFDSQGMYIISALLIHNYYKKVGGKSFYDVLIHDLFTLSDGEVLQFFKNELNVKQISEFVLKTEAPDWPHIYIPTDNIN